MKIKYKSLTSLTDEEIIAFYKKEGDNNCIGELFKRYTHLVFGVCMKYLKNEEESKDGVMQVFEKLLVDLENHDIQNFKSWLYSVAKNHCLMKIRKDSSEKNAFNNYLINIRQDFMESDGEMHQDNKEELEVKISQLQLAIDQLKDEQKMCVELFYMKDKSYKDIANITGFDIKKVKSFIQNGKRNIMLKMHEKKDG